MKHKRVALLVSSLKSGGAERQAVELACALQARQWEPVIITTEGLGPLHGRLKAAGVPVEKVETHFDRAKWNPGFWLNLFATIRSIRSICAARDVSILQSLLFWQNVLAVPAAMRHPAIRAVVTGRRNAGLFKEARPHYAWIENRLNAHADAIVCNSEFVREDTLERERVDAAKLRVIPNGIDVTLFPQRQAGGGSPIGEIVIGTVGNLKRQKRHDIFVDVIAGLHAAGLKARGRIIGRDLGELRDVMKHAESLGIAEFIAVRAADDVVPELHAFDVFLLTSDFEGMPNVVMESMACGVSVVATDAGGTRELLPNRDFGIVVPTGDVEGLVQGVLEIVGDAAAASEMAARARRRIEQEFSIDAMADRYVALYEELLGR